MGVDLVLVHRQAVAGGRRLDRAGRQRPPQPEDLRLESSGAVVGQPVGPDVLEEAIGRDDVAPLEQEGAEEAALAGAGRREIARAVRDAKRAEHPVPHCRPL
jgi:hypothetical protein